MKFVRLKRKLDFVGNDIIQYQTSVADLNEKISAIDLKLDEYFSKLRAINKTNRKFDEHKYRQNSYHKKHYDDNEDNKKYEIKETKNFSIEDIVVIKKSKSATN